MTDRGDNSDLGTTVFHDNDQEREPLFRLGQTCSNCFFVFLSKNFVILLIIFGSFQKFVSQENVKNQLLPGAVCVVQQELNIALTKTNNKLYSTKFNDYLSLVGPSKTGISQLAHRWPKILNLFDKGGRQFDKKNFLYQNSRLLFRYPRRNGKNQVFAMFKLWTYPFVENQL